MNERFYLLDIRLIDIEPVIWRNVVVPARISLDRLHDVIQIVMGWEDSHLHQFTIGARRYTQDPQDREDGLDESHYRLVDLIKQKGRAFHYHYDFGDDWQHQVTIMENRSLPPALGIPLECADGARACPPENVGGAPGYHSFREAVKDPRHEANDSAWYSSLSGSDGAFDSERFDLDRVNGELITYWRWSRDRNLPW